MSAGGGTTAKAVVPAHLTWVDQAGVPQQMLFDLVKGEDYDFGADITEHPVEQGSDITDNVRDRTDEATLELFLTNEPIESNNFQTMAKLPQVLAVASSPPQLPASPVLEYDKWDNMIVERALLTGAGGLTGGAIGGGTGSAIGAVGGGVLGSLILAPHSEPVVQPIQSTGPSGGGPSPPISPQTFQFVSDTDFVAETIDLLRTLKKNAQLFDIVAPKLTIQDTVIEGMKVHRGEDTGTGAEVTLSMKQIRFVETTTVPAPKPTIPTAKPAVSVGDQNPTPAAPAQQQSVASAQVGMIGGSSPFGQSLGPSGEGGIP